MSTVLYERDGRIARITLNRPDVMNAINDELPRYLAAAVAQARRLEAAASLFQALANAQSADGRATPSQ